MTISLIWLSHSEDKGFNKDSGQGTAYSRAATDKGFLAQIPA